MNTPRLIAPTVSRRHVRRLLATVTIAGRRYRIISATSHHSYHREDGPLVTIAANVDHDRRRLTLFADAATSADRLALALGRAILTAVSDVADGIDGRPI